MNRREALRALMGTAGLLALKPVSSLFAADATTAVNLPEKTAPTATAVPPASFTFTPEKITNNFDTAPIKTELIAPNLHLISGPGGNIGVFEGTERLVVVDAGVPARANDVLAAVQAVSPKPIGALINTHWHFDHVGANEAMAKAGAHIYAHENVRRRLCMTNHIEFMGIDVPPLLPIALPTVTYDQGMLIYPEELRITHFPPAHTDGDSAVFFPALNVAQTGDVFFNGFYPFIDSSTGGSIDGMIAAADRILSLSNAATKIIPGHGPLGTRDDLIKFRDMLITARDRIKPLFAGGKSMEEIVAARPIAELDADWGKGFLSTDQFTKLVYLCLKRRSAPQPN